MTQWRYWRWQVLRNLPLVVGVSVVVAVFGNTVIGLMPQQQTAMSRLVLETPLAFNETPRAARSSQDMQHLQVVVHSLMSLEGRTEIAQSIGIDVPSRTRLEAKINAGRDKPTNLIITAHAGQAKAAGNLAAAASQFAMLESGRLQRDRVEASLTNLKSLVRKQSNALVQANQNLADLTGPPEQDLKLQLTRLEQKAQQITSQITGKTAQVVPTDPALLALQKELSKAVGIFSDRHPKVRLLRSRITQLSTVPINVQDPKPLEQQRDLLRAEIASLTQAQSKHESATIAQADASSRLVQSKDALTQARLRGERSIARLKLIEDANLQTASRQKRQMALYAALAVIAMALAAVAAVMRVRSDRRLRRPFDLTKSLGLTPFATIPHLGPSLT